VNPGKVGGDAVSEAKWIAGDFKFHGQAAPGAYPQCGDDLINHQACADMESGWMGDFLELYHGGSLDTKGCTLTEEEEVGKASFSWHLTPRFFKHAKK
jgi:hypothetical protein